MRRILVPGLFLAIAGCVAPSSPPPKPAPPAPVPTPAPAPPPPVRSGDWRDWPLTPGDWSYRRAGTHTEAAYGEPGMKPVLVMRCDRAGQRVRLIWATAAAGPVTVLTTDGATPRAAGRSEAGLEVDFATRDPLLDQMAFSRGRFMLLAGGQAVIVPAWPEVSRVIEDCR